MTEMISSARSLFSTSDCIELRWIWWKDDDPATFDDHVINSRGPAANHSVKPLDNSVRVLGPELDLRTSTYVHIKLNTMLCAVHKTDIQCNIRKWYGLLDWIRALEHNINKMTTYEILVDILRLVKGMWQLTVQDLLDTWRSCLWA